MFCETCVALVRNVEEHRDQEVTGTKDDPLKHFNHHSLIDKLLDAITGGCYLCQSIADNTPRILNPAECPKNNPRGLKYDCIYERKPRQEGRFDLRLCFLTARYGDIATTFTLRPLDEEVLNVVQGTIPSFTGDDSVINQARTWLQTCLNEHEVCKRCLVTQGIWPSRVLDLLASDLPKNHFRLVSRSTLPPNQVMYVTLSHRWGFGAQEPFKLTQVTSGHLLNGMRVDRLSGLFQDAVKVCLRLGQRYLWIDSLCIFQDDPSSIVAEALAMGEVYGNAICNIAALTAKQSGIFVKRDPTALSPSATILSASPIGTKASYAIADGQLWSRSVFEAPLSKRGWVLQEQILAQRTIYFGQKQMLWTCPNGAFCETYPMNDPIWSSDRFYTHQRRFDDMRMTALQAVHRQNGHDPLGLQSETEAPEAGYARTWRGIVSEYVVRHLTNINDRLLAISGIATPFARVTDDILLAGLWRKGMPQNLLWQVGSEQDFSRTRDELGMTHHNTEKGIPSWSWASMNKPIAFNSLIYTRKKVIASVKHIDTEYEVLGNTTRIIAGPLHLKAAALRLYQVDASRGWYGLLAQPQDGASKPKIAQYVNTYFDMPNTQVTDPTYLAAFVTCGVNIDRKTKQVKGVEYEGLILHQHDKKEDGFSRVGTFRVWDSSLEEPGRVGFMPEYSALAACKVDENGKVEYTPLDFDASYMYLFKIV